MKTQLIIPLMLLAACCAVSAQTTNSPTNPTPPAPKKSMSYTLRNLQNDKTIPNPTDADIRATVASLKDDFGPVLALEGSASDQALSMDEIEKGKFGFTCMEGKTAYIIKEGQECSPEVAIKIIISYRDGTPVWKTLGVWRQIKT